MPVCKRRFMPAKENIAAGLHQLLPGWEHRSAQSDDSALQYFLQQVLRLPRRKRDRRFRGVDGQVFTVTLDDDTRGVVAVTARNR